MESKQRDSMVNSNLIIRPYETKDEPEVIDLWFRCNLVIPANNPKADIKRKLQVNPELFLIGTIEDRIVATCMAGYEGRRGWINYLAVSPELRRQGIAIRIMEAAESKLKEIGCPKINLQIRANNPDAIRFYKSIGYIDDNIINMGKRLMKDPPYKYP